MTVRRLLLMVMMRVQGQTDQGVEFPGLAQQVQTVVRLLLGHKVCIRIVPDEILCRDLGSWRLIRLIVLLLLIVGRLRHCGSRYE